jgi:hypothetical protein
VNHRQPVVTEQGVTYPADDGPQGAYLAQLLDEGYAEQSGSAVILHWIQVYRLLRDPQHVDSLELLGLPKPGPWVPVLESRGTPSEGTFKMAISGWQGAGSQVGPAAAVLQGGAITVRGHTTLLAEAAWQLRLILQDCATQGYGTDGAERLATLAKVRALALGCGAILDRYLAQTEVVAPDKIRLKVKRDTVLGTSVVELVPELEAAPARWLPALDRFAQVQKRYDVPSEQGGMTHVVPTEAVRQVLGVIKAYPGRRVASDEALALVRNPFAVLGDEAADVIDPQQYEADLADAGISFCHLQMDPTGQDDNRFRFRIVDPLGRQGDQQIETGQHSRLAALVEAAERSRRKGLPLFAWEGNELEFGDDTNEALSRAARWLARSSLASLSVSYAEVFDLSAYSDRVTGFEGRIAAVPFVARKDPTKGWIPENTEYGIAVPDAKTGGSLAVKLAQADIAEFAGEIARAKAAGSPRVPLPGQPGRNLPLADAETILATIQQHLNESNTPRKPALQKDPQQRDGGVPTLQIIHNIEALGYGGKPDDWSAGSLAPPEVPAWLRQDVRLLPHQETGLAWLQDRYRSASKGIRGVLLADDMGLGKTLQALCLITWYRQQTKDPRPCLVVAPVSLLENWQVEIRRFFNELGDLTVCLYGDYLKNARLAHQEIDAELRSIGLRKFLRTGFETDAEIVLTTYETLRDYEFSLARVQWGIVVFDEAQKIKTPAALVTRAAKAMKADFRVVCTGTPVENTLADLWCLFDVIQPGLLGSLNEFTRTFRRSIETRESGHEELLEQLRTAIAPWILRRLKSEVADLPPKREMGPADESALCAAIPMSPLQAQLYASAIARFRQASIHPDRARRGADMLATLHQLRMICASPLSVAEENPDLVPIEDHIRHSPKLAWLLDQIDAVRQQGEKAIVFTEFRGLQRIVQRALASRFGIHAEIVNGSTSVDPGSESSRQGVIDRFQQAPGFGVIILSTTAVGFGVNVQAANHVCHFTRPWNPAKEDQATDRVYRIGQTRPVFVYYPTIAGIDFQSFDQRVAQLLGEKRSLSRDMLAVRQEITFDEFTDL